MFEVHDAVQGTYCTVVGAVGVVWCGVVWCGVVWRSVVCLVFLYFSFYGLFNHVLFSFS